MSHRKRQGPKLCKVNKVGRNKLTRTITIPKAYLDAFEKRFNQPIESFFVKWRRDYIELEPDFDYTICQLHSMYREPELSKELQKYLKHKQDKGK
ncbi:MAG: hypothetical protein LBH74_09920 [Nitrososphaerota archaeon]|jgi:hypothetical protein|nr:hypothetical protein [Nitrososphaerota archaeon]